jgi:predicted TIM-barrel fold metal-dependent hydrolase
MVNYRKFVFLLGIFLISAISAPAQQRLPILDMHMHARVADHYGPPPLPICAPVDRMPVWDQSKSFLETLEKFQGCKKPVWSPKTDEEVLRQTVAVMEKYNIFGVLGGKPELVAKWMKAAPGRFIPGLDFRLDRATGTATATGDGSQFKPMSPDEIRALYQKGAFRVFGEVLNQYAGIAPDDERMELYWAMTEELDIPVGIHLGPGGPGEFYLGNRGYRARLQSALTLEEVLVRHPRLRVYIMHAGYPMLDDLLALLFSHPQVYVEVSMLANVEPRPAFYRYLKAVVDHGYGERVMFGSDQMVWPGLIEPAIEAVEKAPFLTRRQKRDIFYNNAARFLRLNKEEMTRHQAMPPPSRPKQIKPKRTVSRKEDRPRRNL